MVGSAGTRGLDTAWEPASVTAIWAKEVEWRPAVGARWARDRVWDPMAVGDRRTRDGESALVRTEAAWGRDKALVQETTVEPLDSKDLIVPVKRGTTGIRDKDLVRG